LIGRNLADLMRILSPRAARPTNPRKAGLERMTDRFRETLGLALIMVGVLGLEAFGLRSGSIGIILLGVLSGIAAVIVAVRVDLKWAGMIALLASAFTLTWNGWFIGPVRPGDVLVLVALICFVLADPNHSLRWPPWWVKQLGILIALVAVIHVFFPASDNYLAQRIVLNSTGKPIASYKGSLAGANLGVGFKFIVATVFIALAFAAATKVDKRAVHWLTVSFVIGTAISGGVAFTDSRGFTSLTKLLVRGRGCASTIGASCAHHGGNRQLGFSNHPNFLAASLVIAAPFAIWLMAKRDRTRNELILGAVLLPPLVLGVYASGSRGGAVCIVFALGLSVVAFPRTRQYLVGWAIFGAVLAGSVIVFVPALGNSILRATRLKGSAATTSGSDTVRHMVGHQGILDFQHSPLQGVGLQVSFEASQVYIQELASGGLLLFMAMSIYMLGGMYTAARLMPENDLPAAVLAALVATLALNIVEADLTARFYYVPAAILVAYVYAREAERSPPDEGVEPAGPGGQAPARAMTS
jgi:hypothetical protein